MIAACPACAWVSTAQALPIVPLGTNIAAAYWRAEALSRVDMSTEAITYFQAVADTYAGHYLATAALNRADRLRLHLDIISGAAD